MPTGAEVLEPATVPTVTLNAFSVLVNLNPSVLVVPVAGDGQASRTNQHRVGSVGAGRPSGLRRSCQADRHQPRPIDLARHLTVPELQKATADIALAALYLASDESGYVTGVGKLKGRLIILLDITKLLHRPEFKRLEEAAELVGAAK